ncbi:hypothetical protein DYB25_001082 [Aphanomyces astaci]|uniref:GIY-YIG domain-containing protein n=1 Tax=Aphanomyces astaci TaxID=112090 RepID=A0A397DHT8_APHAT|nr:hypothetical protein DYB25_001082 [Aphanomyces astaci]RHY45063.1 hypothetical protein DYB30_003956 [Aphanomyces astaci]RHY53882.1 hypothetical protein DYB34_003885 [Aphanomyces astaci]RHY64695.1 hypothetical protein DYB38_003775 [Aphanomyces astaci]RHZ04933.1 hypothetical protein DYB31_002426 [Aphanomyces astaci]
MIINKDKTIRYIGVTSKPIEERLAQHKRAAQNGSGKCSIHKHMRLHGVDEFEIVAIETLVGVTKREAEARETFFMTQVACINERRSFVDEEEQREQKRENMREYNQANREQMRERYQANREQRLEYARERVTCECGAEYSRANKSKHLKTRHHQRYLQEQQD